MIINQQGIPKERAVHVPYIHVIYTRILNVKFSSLHSVVMIVTN